MIETIEKLDELCFKIYCKYTGKDRKFPQVENTLDNYISADPKMKMAQFPGSMKHQIADIDSVALNKNEVYKGQIAQFIVRTVIAIDTLCENSRAPIIRLEPIEKFVIKQIVYLFKTNRTEELFFKLATGSKSLLEGQQLQEIYEEVTNGLSPSDLAHFKKEVETQSPLKVILGTLVHFRYKKQMSSQINDIISGQKEDIFAPEISVDLIKEIAKKIVIANAPSDVIAQILNKYINAIKSEIILGTEAVKNINGVNPSGEEVCQIMDEIMRNQSNIPPQIIDAVFKVPGKNDGLSDTSHGMK